MQDLINKLTANDFAALKGLRISGSVPVQDKVINELLTEFLQRSTQPTPPPAANPAPAPVVSAEPPAAPGIGLPDILKLVKRAEVKSGEGAVTVEFEIAI